MILALVISILLHLGLLALLDTLGLTPGESHATRSFKIRISFEPPPPTPEPAEVVPQPPAIPRAPEAEEVVLPRAPMPTPDAEVEQDSVVAGGDESAPLFAEQSPEAGASPTSPILDRARPVEHPQVPPWVSDPIPRDDNRRPRYPRKARRLGWEGTVLLTVEVLPNGTSGKIEIKKSSGYVDLDRAAVAAIRRWRFEPAQAGGSAVSATVEIPVIFTLSEWR